MAFDNTNPNGGVPRKPRIALMGEFSAGKSTLSNLLLGARPLPEKVTATRLSPVWISVGAPAATRVMLDGTLNPVDIDRIGEVPIEDTKVIRLSLQSDLLEECDLIDCPGISDPNMPSEVWERLVPEIDAVLWCTHATQAWRQSEAAVWETIPEQVRERSALLITRFDKLTTDRDRRRVVARVEKETAGQFAGIFPISLTGALAAGEDFAKWESSGAHAFSEHLLKMIDTLKTGIASGAIKTPKAVPSEPLKAAAPVQNGKPIEAPKTEATTPEAPAPVAQESAETAAIGAGIAPRRVRAILSDKSSRPSRPMAAEEPAPEAPRRPLANPTMTDLRSVLSD